MLRTEYGVHTYLLRRTPPCRPVSLGRAQVKQAERGPARGDNFQVTGGCLLDDCLMRSLIRANGPPVGNGLSARRLPRSYSPARRRMARDAEQTRGYDNAFLRSTNIRLQFETDFVKRQSTQSAELPSARFPHQVPQSVQMSSVRQP